MASRVAHYILLVVFPSIVSAQKPDSSTLLNEVVIERQRIEELALGHYSIKVDSNTQTLAASATAADLMQKFGYGHVRSYGPGGLTTLSLRGTGSGHSSILWNGIPLQVTPPIFVMAKIVETDPGVRGDTVTGGTKPAKLETGATVRVPLFINEGEVIKVDTRTGTYISRVKQ